MNSSAFFILPQEMRVGVTDLLREFGLYLTYILLGNYDLLHFCNLNGQTARRGLEIHFPRYQFHQGPDREAFQKALLTLLRQIPLLIDEQALLDRWWDFYERSTGCVGVLSQWLVRATALALREESEVLTWSHLERRALSAAKCTQMAADVKDGEDELRYAAETYRGRLRSLLGMSDTPVETPHLSPQDASAALSDHMGARPDPSKGASKGRVGKRAPERDPVGEMGTTAPSSTCPFKGVIEVLPAQMKEMSVWRVQCPECATTRSLNADGPTVKFPSHPKRKTETPHYDVRWIKRGTTWELSQKRA